MIVRTAGHRNRGGRMSGAYRAWRGRRDHGRLPSFGRETAVTVCACAEPAAWTRTEGSVSAATDAVTTGARMMSASTMLSWSSRRESALPPEG